MLDAVYSLSDHPWKPLYNSNSSDSWKPLSPFTKKDVALRVVVAFTCSLSMLGALLIILSYICLKSIRTKTRQIIVHLSIADFGTACANFIGATVNFDHYILKCKDSGNNTYPGISCSVVENLCTAQAFFANYFTVVSILWTLSLSVYIHCLVVHSGLRTHKMVVYFSYVFCWGMPLVVSVWLVATGRLGYAPIGGSGWCSLKLNHGLWSEDIYVLIFANDLWIYLTFFLVTVLYFSTHCYIRSQLRDSSLIFLSARGSLSALHSADTKFLFIPFAFLLLRIWSVIMVVLKVYLHDHSLPPLLYHILLYATGIGDSGQGFVNALLFCGFTPKVRNKLLCCCRDRNCSCRCCQRKTDMDHFLSSPASTTSFPSENQPCINTSVDQKSTVT